MWKLYKWKKREQPEVKYSFCNNDNYKIMSRSIKYMACLVIVPFSVTFTPLELLFGCSFTQFACIYELQNLTPMDGRLDKCYTRLL